MAGNTNFPTGLDDDASLFDVTDGSTALLDEHHNNLKEAIKAIEAKIGIRGTQEPTAMDFRLGDPTSSHNHDGATGSGRPITPSMSHMVGWQYQGSIPSGASLGAPFSFGRTVQIVSVQANVRRAPSGATLALTVRVGPTSLWGASPGLGPIMQAGTNGYQGASPNLQTYPSGARFVVDADKVGTNDPGQDLSLMFVFRE